MRRPLKPFVTEYKQSSRRLPTQQPMDLTFSEADRPAPKSVDLAPREPEDSYEAAMRAADALFSTRPLPSRVDPRGCPPATAGTTGAGHSETPLFAEPGKPEANSGRILRVLDEQPSAQLTALEAERAPKRRGRKPGSKNKPKSALLADGPERLEGGEADAPWAAGTATVAPSPRLPTAQVEALVAEPGGAAPQGVASRGTVPRGEKRSAPWARGRLRPGEEWKRRRLPRVCW